jgi:phosphatidate cytidylyltransferase
MGQRIRTAIIAIPIALALIKWGGIPFSVGVLLLAIVGWREYRTMLQNLGYPLYGITPLAAIALLIAFVSFRGSNVSSLFMLTPMVVLFSLLIMLEGLYHHAKGHWAENTALSCLAVLYLGLPFAHFVLLRNLNLRGLEYALPLWGVMTEGEALLWTVMFGTWASDTFAYFGGRLMGKTPLAPAVSPHKTREGAFWGFVGTLFVVVLMGHAWLGFALLKTAGLALLVAVFAPLGDLVESVLKRNCGIKDSGNFFPGHGGVLDRCDSLIFSIPIAFYYMIFILF